MNLADALSAGLAKHVGTVLTGDDARKLAGFILWATQPADLCRDPAQFEPEEYKGVTFQVERMRDVVEEIKPLHQAHWQETEGYRHDQVCNPDYEAFIYHERIGQYMLFTVRKDGILVGNCAVYVTRSTHTQELVAREDTLFILKDHRAGLIGKRFFQYCERVLESLGVSDVNFDVKLTNNVWKVWKRMGYDIVGHSMRKKLKGASNAAQV